MHSEISVLELKEKLDNKEDIIIIDVREKHELNICRLPFTISIEMNDIPNRLDSLNEDKHYIIMCRSGVRSGKVSDFLREKGFSYVQNLTGGILAWANKIDSSLTTY